MKEMRIPFKKKVQLGAFGQYRKVQAKMHDLQYLFWECTLRCNLNCLHCGSDCRRTSATKDMPLRDFLLALDEISTQYDPKNIMVVLTGGEPLLRTDLEACGREFVKRKYPWGMVTNGYNLTADRLEMCCAGGLASITVSLDGLKTSHNWLRGAGESYGRALNALALCAGKKHLVHDAVTCVNQKNFGELGELQRILIDKGVKKWRLFTIFPKGRAKDNKAFGLSGGQFVELMEFIKAGRKEGRIEPSFSCEGFLGPYEGEVRDDFFFCRAGINIGSVLADGSISACPSLRADYIQGNIYKDSFLDVWNNRYQVMRDREWTKTGKCRDCRAFKWCGGNGLHLRDERTGELLQCYYDEVLRQ
jgi:radical SAM enzyme (rSAM/lipoprotein system)